MRLTKQQLRDAKLREARRLAPNGAFGDDASERGQHPGSVYARKLHKGGYQ